MSCICQYFVHSTDQVEAEDPTNVYKDGMPTENPDLTSDPASRSEISATDLATARAENWLLNKNLMDARITVENLESLVKTIMDKQNVMLTEMYHLKRLNQDLEEECRMQREYHEKERNAMIRELQDVREMVQKRSKLLEETIQKNNELNGDVIDANEKIYAMGMKYLRLKNERSYHSSEQSEGNASTDEEQSE